MHGLGPFRRNLDEKLDLALWAEGELRRIPEMEIVAPPELSLLAFRLAPKGRDAAALDDLNRRLLAAVNARGRVHLTATTAGGRYVVRICVLSFRTHHDRMVAAIEDLKAVAGDVLSR